MSEKVTIVLEDIADKLEKATDDCEQYLNTVTGEFAVFFDGSYVEMDEELAEEIECSDDYIRLPNQYGLREYRIMKDFTEATQDAVKQEKLYRALRGKKAYRHFKDTLNNTGLDEAYYAFRFLAHIEIARNWCAKNEVPYIMNKVTKPQDINLNTKER